MKTILFVTYGGGHVNMLIPVIRHLSTLADFNCLVMGLTTAASQLARCGIQSVGFSSLLRDDDVRAISHGRRLFSSLPQDGAVDPQESIAYLGLSYADLEERLGVEGAAVEYALKGRQAFLPLGPMRRACIKYAPDVIVTTISPRAEQAAILVASEMKIPSVCLIDLFARPSLKRASTQGYATRVCVISDSVKNWLIRAGRRPDEVVVTGNPVFDELFARDIKSKAVSLREKNKWQGKKVILWASQIEPERNPFSGRIGDPSLPWSVEACLKDIIRSKDDWHLVIRYHPNQGCVPTSEVDEKITISERNEPLAPLLQAVDLVVTLTSTVGLEARLLGKPLITVDMSVYSDDTPYAKLGFSVGIDDLSELESAMSRLLDGCIGPNSLSELPRIGMATDSVVQQILKLSNEGA